MLYSMATEPRYRCSSAPTSSTSASISASKLVQVYEKIRTLLQDEHLQTAKQLLQIVGVVQKRGSRFAPRLPQVEKDKPIEKVQTVPQTATPALIAIDVVGNDNTINITPEVFKLAENQKVLNAVKETLAPIE